MYITVQTVNTRPFKKKQMCTFMSFSLIVLLNDRQKKLIALLTISLTVCMSLKIYPQRILYIILLIINRIMYY